MGPLVRRRIHAGAGEEPGYGAAASSEPGPVPIGRPTEWGLRNPRNARCVVRDSVGALVHGRRTFRHARTHASDQSSRGGTEPEVQSRRYREVQSLAPGIRLALIDLAPIDTAAGLSPRSRIHE